MSKIFLSFFGIAKEHDIPLIRCITPKKYKEWNGLWKGQG
jgi:hypothetical protein